MRIVTQVLTEDQLAALMRRVEQYGRDADEQLEGVLDPSEQSSPTRSRVSKRGRAVSSAMRSTAKTGRRRPAASQTPLAENSGESDTDQVGLQTLCMNKTWTAYFPHIQLLLTSASRDAGHWTLCMGHHVVY